MIVKLIWKPTRNFMEITNLNKTLTEIFTAKYIIPLYQRNFAWSDEEITQLLVDLYESYRKDKNGNYFIGSLVVLRRRSGEFEVIDGQQRLTVITLIARILGVGFLNEPKLFYDSRPEVESFFAYFFQTGQTNDVTFDYKVSHLVHAVDVIRDSVINPDEKIKKTISDLITSYDFKLFFSNYVILVRVEIPNDTDVANYFEIMNNRGEQLQKHEILKAKLLDRIKKEDASHDFKKQETFSKIWNACSQMDIPIQKLFTKTDREQAFGNNYDIFQMKEVVSSTTDTKPNISDNVDDDNTIEAILQNGIKMRRTRFPTSKNDDEDIIDDESEDKSIIDFPNFLMHIFKIKYSNAYKEKIDNEKSDNDIPLNEKDLLSVFNVISNNIDPINFIIDLLYYRTVFDRYVIKASVDEMEEVNYKWYLDKPYKYTYEARNTTSLKYKPTFDSQERIVKCLSLMQVTFRNRKYKNWLQDILTHFSDKNKFVIKKEEFQKFLDELLLRYFDENFNTFSEDIPYNEGTRTPHFLFNFIDYLYWVNSINKDKSINFEFKYRNSVEHHLPQSFRNEINKDWIDNLGNLCLISKNSNSKMNNEAPVGKANTNGKYYRNNLPPKQKVMYDETNQSNKWDVEEIKKHYADVIYLLSNAKEILTIK